MIGPGLHQGETMRPPSIVRFDRLYLAAIAIGLVGSILEWPVTTARIASQPETAALGGAASAVAAAMLAVGTLLSLLLWYLAARRAVTVAKWVIVAFTAISVVGLLLSIANGYVLTDAAGIARMVAVVLQVVATVNLFRPDAVAWFAPMGEGNDR